VSAGSEQPLAGIRIIDFTHDWAGPHATRIMGDYGAEVLKIEYTPRLCGMRGAYLERRNSHPRWWEINRNKGSITLNLHLPAQLEACKRLIATADAIVDNSRPGVMAGFGLGFEVLQALKADIIVIAMSAYGATGPESQYAGYGGAIEAISGVQSLTAYDPAGDRMRIRELDVTNGVMGACALMTALLHRELTGEGQFVDLAQREATTWMIGDHLLAHTTQNTYPSAAGNRHPDYVQGCYRCRDEDRWAVITIRNDAEWRSLCVAMQRGELGRDERFASAAARLLHHDALDQVIESWTRTQDDKALAALLQSQGIAAGYVANAADLAADPHLQERGWWTRDPLHSDAGRYPGFPFAFVGEEAALFKRRGPDLGEDNARILGGEIGWDIADYESLHVSDLGTAYDLE
jgi:crotonobetainyl-CoA:carnitine CoA-transferase CaiB-like acyl-CoA transferase